MTTEIEKVAQPILRKAEEEIESALRAAEIKLQEEGLTLSRIEFSTNRLVPFKNFTVKMKAEVRD